MRHTLEYRVRHANGGYVEIEDTGQVLRSLMGDPLRAIGFLKDIGQRKQAAAEHARLDAQLREAQRLEALGTMAGGIAHDFNNILGAVTGYAELAYDRAPADERLRQPLRAIQDAGRRGKALIEQILAFARRAPPARRPVALAPLLQEAGALVSVSAPPHVEVRIRIDHDGLIVLGDPTQIHQIVMNLATNGLQAVQDALAGQHDARGSVELALSRTRTSGTRALSHGVLAAGDYAVIGVTDTGTGISHQALPHIFDPFFTTKEPGRGTGLGLPLVHGIVAAHEGAIDVRTEPGTETTVTVYLPIMEEAASVEDGAPSAMDQGRGQTVMVVDDDPAMLALAEERLAELGYEPVGYGSSAQALAAFEVQPQRFDAVVTDERMPDLTGTELAQRMRARNAKLPVVVVSGYGGAQLEAKAHAAGVTAVLAKPYSAVALGEALTRALRDARA